MADPLEIGDPLGFPGVGDVSDTSTVSPRLGDLLGLYTGFSPNLEDWRSLYGATPAQPPWNRPDTRTVQFPQAEVPVSMHTVTSGLNPTIRRASTATPIGAFDIFDRGPRGATPREGPPTLETTPYYQAQSPRQAPPVLPPGTQYMPPLGPPPAGMNAILSQAGGRVPAGLPMPQGPIVNAPLPPRRPADLGIINAYLPPDALVRPVDGDPFAFPGT